MQHTLNETTSFKGKTLHSGEIVTMTIHPADVDHGIVFVRKDIKDVDNLVPALWDRVETSQLCTRLKNDSGVTVSTIEHLMSAFAGMGIDNVLVELNGAELPILDGSAQQFVSEFEKAGLQPQDGLRKAYRILEAVEVRDDKGRFARFEPDVSSIFEFKIDFESKAVGQQHRVFELMDTIDFKNEIADCRTFTPLKDVESLMKMGLIKGGGLDNAVVFDDEQVINPEGMRCTDEPVRHKILDAIGDVYLAGHPVIGRFVCEYGGHALTNQLLRKLFDTPNAFAEVVDHLGIGQSENLSSTPKLAYNA